MSHTCLQLKVSNVKLLWIVKRSRINGITYICIRAKCGASLKQRIEKRLQNLLWLTCWPCLDMFGLSWHVRLFRAKFCFLSFRCCAGRHKIRCNNQGLFNLVRSVIWSVTQLNNTQLHSFFMLGEVSCKMTAHINCVQRLNPNLVFLNIVSF